MINPTAPTESYERNLHLRRDSLLAVSKRIILKHHSESELKDLTSNKDSVE